MIGNLCPEPEPPVQAMKIKSEKGFSLMETIVALALLGIIGVAFLNGLATTSTARVTADERVSAKILAENLMENVKKQSYTTNSTLYEYTIPSEFEGYSANLTVENLKNDEIQMLSITIWHRGRNVLTLEGYKVDRSDAS